MSEPRIDTDYRITLIRSGKFLYQFAGQTFFKSHEETVICILMAFGVIFGACDESTQAGSPDISGCCIRCNKKYSLWKYQISLRSSHHACVHGHSTALSSIFAFVSLVQPRRN
jgi:hypothetical protein